MLGSSLSFDIPPQAIIDGLALGHCLFFGFFTLAARRHNSANVYLAAFMFTFAIASIGEIFLISSSRPEIKFFLMPAEALLPPFIYLYVAQLTSPRPKLWERRRLCHFLPFGVAFLLLVPWMILPADLKHLPMALDLGWLGKVEKPLWPAASPAQPFNNETAPASLLAATIGLLLFVGLYAVQVTANVLGLIIIFLRHQKRIRQNFSYTETVKLQWLGFLCVIFVVMWVTVVPLNLLSLTLPIGEFGWFIQGTTQLGLIYLLGIVGMRQPVVYPPGKPWVLVEHGKNEPIAVKDNLPTENAAQSASSNQRQKYARSGLSKEDMQRIAAKLDHAMTEKQLFLDSMLTLPELARQTGISTNYITQVINEHLGKNFFDFVNGFRVAKAKRELLALDKTMLDTAFAVGFNSKSTFNATFKKLVGQTPSQFRTEERAKLVIDNKNPDALPSSSSPPVT